ncbi:NADPH--cytochrome P450 reductase [Ktedonobacteria bacterium brp13]|nr:NADPH--cytochrome P450 reductase [Ktedonobacteria bacterium brp13]
MSTKVFTPIPQPKEKPVFGNLLDISGKVPVQRMMSLAREYGPIYKLQIPGRNPLVIVSGYALANELSDETRFDKKVWAPLGRVRTFAGDGLFTAHTDEPNWHKAHNILLPNFGMKAMQGYLPMMVDIAEQLVGKWERLNSDDEVDIPNEMTRLTLDTIGLCGFDYRFNSFYKEEMHPFITSLADALGEALSRGSRLPIEDKLMIHKHHQFQANVKLMNDLVDRIIQERRTSGEDLSEKKDLLSYMLTGVDKQSGEQLDDTNIRYQIITFLIAGHETTSGLLSFTIYQLLHHHAILQKAYEEVDRVLGADLSARPTFNQVNQLHYVTQILKESLRLWPTAPAFALYPREGEAIIGGKYKITADDDVAVLIPMLHRDRAIWGDDAEEFNPERLTVEKEQQLPPNAYKPFGNGQRACIGRQFALQEAALVLGMLLQRFKFIDATNYQLKIKETLTLKPDNFKIKIKKRTAADRSVIVRPQESVQTQNTTPIVKSHPQVHVPKHHTGLTVLFGSNMGGSEEIATRIAEDGALYGFDVQQADLDDYTNKLPEDGALIVVTASYNGTPPDNAEKFCTWLRSDTIANDAFKHVKYTVFGCGNRDWAATFQAIPHLIDEKLAAHGAQRIYPSGEGDQRDDFDGQFENWYQNLWRTLFKELAIDAQILEEQQSIGTAFEVEIIKSEQINPLVKSFGARPVTVRVNRELHNKEGEFASERSTRHIEFELPEGVSYRTGWHLGIIPRNNEEQVKRIARRFNFSPDTYIRLHKNDQRKSNLPTETPVSLYALLTDYVELQDVATRKQVKTLADFTECPPDKRKLMALSGDDDASIARYKNEILTKRKSLIDLLEEFQACELPFSAYLEMLPALRPRYYSISSAPQQDAQSCSITLGVVEAPAKSGQGQFHGVCSSYLSKREPGEQIDAFIQDTHSTFMLPEETSAPIIMVGPGTGVAPYRGFLQERAALQAQGSTIGESLLFFGCRHPQQDYIYEDEFKSFAEQGVTELYTAFSRGEGHEKMYVQDQILAHKERVWELLQQDAYIYVCGDASAMAPDVRKAFAMLYMEKSGASEQEAEQWLAALTTNNHYLVDIWPA